MKKHEAQKTSRKNQNRRKSPQGSSSTKNLKEKDQLIQSQLTQKEIRQRFEKKRISHSIKYEDIGSPLNSGRINQHWMHFQIVPYFLDLRSGGTIPKGFLFWDHHYLMNYFGLRGWEFGNWTSQEDRLLYVCALGLALYDMNRILGFKHEHIGLAQKITLAIGARGKSKALAHFEPMSFALNLTKWNSNEDELRAMMGLPPKSKAQKFMSSGGVAALAHEYGHALDYFFGGFVDRDSRNFALSDGRSTRTMPNLVKLKQPGIRGDMERLIHAMVWRDFSKKEFTSFYKGMRDFLEKRKVKGDYYYRRNELFARFFEQYIGHELKQKGIKNGFLNQLKYDAPFYMDQALLKKLVPIMRTMIKNMRAFVNAKDISNKKQIKKGCQNNKPKEMIQVIPMLIGASLPVLKHLVYRDLTKNFPREQDPTKPGLFPKSRPWSSIIPEIQMEIPGPMQPFIPDPKWQGAGAGRALGITMSSSQMG